MKYPVLARSKIKSYRTEPIYDHLLLIKNLLQLISHLYGYSILLPMIGLIKSFNYFEKMFSND